MSDHYFTSTALQGFVLFGGEILGGGGGGVIAKSISF